MLYKNVLFQVSLHLKEDILRFPIGLSLPNENNCLQIKKRLQLDYRLQYKIVGYFFSL